MDWVNSVPILISGLPSLSIIVMVWSGLFLVNTLYFINLSRSALRIYRIQNRIDSKSAEKYLALGRLISYQDSTLVAIAGVAIGILVAISQTPPQHFTIRQAILTLAFLIIPLGKLGQAIITKRVNQLVDQALLRKEI